MSRFTVGLVALVLLALVSFFGLTRANPFASPYELTALFRDANSLQPGSPVRMAGVDVGKVKKVEAIPEGRGTSRIEMEVKDTALPIHTDATLKVRPRTFLEGNFFVDLQPGSPSAPIREDGATPLSPSQTAAPVQFGDLLSALQSDTRSDLQVFLKEYSEALEGGGARGFNQALRNGAPAFRSAALVNQAALGREPSADLQRLLRGQQKTFSALAADEGALKDLVTNLNVTAGALAREDLALEESLPALRDTLSVGHPALASLNRSLPSLRAFARDALPGVRTSAPTLREALPFIRQARGLFGRRELRGTARELRSQIPRLSLLNRRLVPFLGQARQLSSCTAGVLVPWANSTIPNPEEPGNDNQRVYRQFNRGLVGLAGESRLFDGNSSYFHTSGVPGVNLKQGGITVRPAPPPDLGDQPPPRRPDVPCETQQPPNMNAPGGPLARFTGAEGRRALPKLASLADRKAALRKAGEAYLKHDRTVLEKGRERRARALEKLTKEARR
ncbi:MAG: MlaD family protein [Actinomycetota bacterium]|nr:MlaD family protein [Actinomycetota bacterium]